MKALWGDAAKSAESSGKTEAQKIANEKKQFLSTCDAAMRAEQWAVNKALHYNAWANFWEERFRACRSSLQGIARMLQVSDMR
jgi:hypothetical protein